jgi:hypothetical protein
VAVLVVLEQVPHGVMTLHAVQSQIAVQTIAVQVQVAVIAAQAVQAVIAAAGEVEEAAVIDEANILIFFVYFMGIGIGVLIGMVIERERSGRDDDIYRR